MGYGYAINPEAAPGEVGYRSVIYICSPPAITADTMQIKLIHKCHSCGHGELLTIEEELEIEEVIKAMT